jgi:hypothetical protein
MEILICEQTATDPQGVTAKGYSVTFVTRNKKKSINEQEFFVEGSEVEAKIQLNFI